MSFNTRAWHLRQDGKAFPVSVHLYAMGDSELGSEAEVASFLIKTKSKDTDLAEYVLDAWMAILAEEYMVYEDNEEGIENAIIDGLKSYGPVGFQKDYVLSNEELLEIHRKNSNSTYHNIESLYKFLHEVYKNISEIQSSIRLSINQQFCRVRYGGKYDSVNGNTGIWFRISSVGYNWDNTIYFFVSEMKSKLRLNNISICRDAESDNNQIGKSVDNFYRAKDGSLYFEMPISEFLTEEHESSPVFSSTNLGRGVLTTIRCGLAIGKTIQEISGTLKLYGVDINNTYIWNHLMTYEINCRTVVVTSDSNISKVFEEASDMIVKLYDEIDNVSIFYNDTDIKGQVELHILVESNVDESIDHRLFPVIIPNKSMLTLTPRLIVKMFRFSYNNRDIRQSIIDNQY